MSGVGETTTAPVSMDVALMQLDCAQPSTSCYAQIARHFEVGRLLWAEIEHAGGRPKKKKPAPTTIRILLFDADAGAIVGKAEETFPGDVSNEALDQLLGRVTAEGAGKAIAP